MCGAAVPHSRPTGFKARHVVWVLHAWGLTELILGGSVLSAIVLFLIREPFFRIVLGGGAFDEHAIARMAIVLGVFTLAMPTESLVHLLARAFYATKNTLIPVIISILGLCIAIGGAVILTPRYGIVALPFSFFLASLTELILLLTLLPRRLRKMQKLFEN